MLNLDYKFEKFIENIKLSDTKLESIRSGRDTIRNKIKMNFLEGDKPQPKFHMQGSYRMGTMIQTLPDIEYDIDDGIYLQNFKGKRKDEWSSVELIHKEIYEIVNNHTNTVENINPCVRVTYSKNYHIDLPIYIIEDDVAYLAYLGKGWVESDPKALRDWFLAKVSEDGETLRSIVKIIKAWKDSLNYESKIIDFCGLAITILVASHYVENESMTGALLLTLTEIIKELEKDCVCYKPVNPIGENLFSNHTYYQKEAIILNLKSFQSEILIARDSDNEKDACDKLKKLFGDRFPSGSKTITNKKFRKTIAPAVINKDGRSA